MKNVVVIAKVTLKDSMDEGVLEAFAALHKATHENDEGCLQYDLHADTEKKNTYVFVETWQSEALLAAHMSKEHFKVFQAALAGKVESKTIEKLEKIL